VSVVCSQVEVSATGWSLVQRSPTECGVSKVWSWSVEMRRPRPLRGCRAVVKKIMYSIHHRKVNKTAKWQDEMWSKN
jgi:hypothetical protein